MAHIGTIDVQLLSQIPGSEPVPIGTLTIPIEVGNSFHGVGDIRVDGHAFRQSLAAAFEQYTEALRSGHV